MKKRSLFLPIFRDLFSQKIPISLVLSGILFLICMSLDFYATNVGSQGNFTEEANAIGRFWWQIAGTFRFIEIPVWAGVVLGMAYILNFKSKYFALVWLNFLAFNHFLGFLTWLPYGTVNFLYTVTTQDWQLGYAMSLISIPFALLLALVQTRIKSK